MSLRRPAMLDTVGGVAGRMVIAIGVPALFAAVGAASGGATTAYGGFWVASLGIIVWALLDAAGSPRSAWSAVAVSRATLLTVLVVGAFFCGIVGYLAAVYYLGWIGPRLRVASE